MPDQNITVRLPDGFDQILREHAGETAAVITDDMRRKYIAALLAAIMDGLQAPAVADGLVRLNGGHVLTLPDHAPLH
jgi:hypothetical protein